MRRLWLVAPLLIALTGCAQLSQVLRASTVTPTAKHQSTRLQNVTLDDATVEATFLIDNPNVMGLKIDGLAWAFALDGQRLFDGRRAGGMNLPAQGRTELKVPITVPFKAIPSLVTTFKDKKEAPYAVQAKATVNTPLGPVTIPLGWEGMLPVPKLPTVSLASARIENLSLSGARVMVQLAVNNPNVFRLPLEALGGRVMVAGQQVAGLSLASARPLAAGEVTAVQLPIDISFASAGFAVASALTAGNATLAVDGNATVGGRALPLNLKTTLTR